ncbi:response regulator [Bradyrhizobium manausense]|uniref:response regulator transcription factor n=1 Tax=Bradyrhizobium TaxID=374 RepID=UPI001BA8915A|nr:MULTISPECIES: response regulator [Bradyrhizobium]MBR0828227.1 response regulator [Bradyrhizobium manausense]UVO25693.1 response regulator [Bradyrhizobium arachidis]
MSAPSVISVIDDDPYVRAAMNNMLKSRGYFVHTFPSAEEFLLSAVLNDTSCVITDVQMSKMSGFDLMTEMRGRGVLTPFIFITGFPDEAVHARALKGGASFLPKPFSTSALIKCLETALEDRGKASA